ncbi:SDR family NAD(P)-dependent oxidoreductase, partial [Streptomyces griseoviridis]|uniref:type I polyketide synthase n=1 Tax=Streptomyces griseoviridis TaxID=45398 RepID=UPI003402428F
AEVFREQGRRVSRLRVSHAFHSSLMEPMLDAFREVVEGLTFSEPRLPVVSNVTGRLAESGELATPAYWVTHVREAVRFGDGVRAFLSEGVSRFVELGPDGVLSGMARASADDAADAVFVPLLRKDRDEVTVALTALAHLHVLGCAADWAAVLDGTGGRTVDLPTYAFQHEYFWPTGTTTATGDIRLAGIGAAGHPLLGAAVELAGADGLVMTGRLSTRSHPWLADHVVQGAVLVPGTALLELAVRAADEAGCDTVEELTLAAPLVLPERGAVRIQVSVGAPDDSGRRTVAIHSRDDEGDGGERRLWTPHAEGILAPAATPTDFDATVWPPKDAAPVDLTDSYERLAEAGLRYGPVFQGLRAAWRRGDDVFAEVALPDGVDGTPFGLHPALFDAALHASFAFGDDDAPSGVPFVWEGVSLHASGASALRVQLTRTGDDTLGVQLADPTGAPVASVDSLTVRAAGANAPASDTSQPLYRVEWVPARSTGARVEAGAVAALGDGIDGFTRHENLEALVATADVPDVVLVGVFEDTGTEVVEGAHAAAERALALVRSWLAEERCADSRLVFVTAVADLTAAPVRGLVRSATLEHPGRFALLDADDVTDREALLAALAVDESETALRGGEVQVPRLTRALPDVDAPTTEFPSEGTVLVTGGTGGLGRIVARHLVAERGVRDVLLVSRSGSAADGVAELVAELSESGARVSVEACDVADADAVAELVSRYEIRAVVHSAGVLDDGMVESLTPERLGNVLRPKVDAAWNLHRATEGRGLDAFVVFSSVAGAFGSAGQGAYAAGNVFLDALVAHRRGLGLPAVSLVWGPWAQDAGMTEGLSETDRRRIARSGLPAVTAEEGVALFDAALASGEPVVLPVRLDLAALRGQDDIPQLLRGLVRTRKRRSAAGGSAATAGLVQRLKALGTEERREVLLDLVRGQIAVVLGHSGAQTVNPDRAFQDLGFDSLTAVELRNRLGKSTGLRLPATVVFDYP